MVELATEVQASTDLSVVRLSAEDPGDDVFTNWVVDATIRLIAELRRLLLDPRASTPIRIAVVLTVRRDLDQWQRAAAEGLCEAVRGVVGALTLERGPSVRINAVLGDATHRGEIQDALSFLSSPQANFVAGSTFDFREAT